MSSSYTYQFYGISLLISLAIYTGKLKQIAIQKVNDKEFNVEYLNTYGFYVVITSLYIALTYAFGFIIHGMIPFPILSFTHSENMLQMVQSSLISNLFMVPISWGTYFLYTKCFKDKFTSTEEASRHIEIWVVMYSICAFILFYLTNETILSLSNITYNTYTSESVVLKSFVFMIMSSALLLFKKTSSSKYLQTKKYVFFVVTMISVLLFIR